MELGNVDSQLAAERLHMAHEWRRLEVSVNFGCRLREQAQREAEGFLAAMREACNHALEEARATDCWREADERCEKELQASNAVLEQQVRVRMAVLVAPVDGLPPVRRGPARPRTH